MFDNGARTARSAHVHVRTYTQAWRVNCPIALSNYEHDAYTVLLMLKSGWW